MSSVSPATLSISPDTPVSDPQADSLGYAPLAERIANAICRTPRNQGYVLAVHGEWGSGKSSLLNFVKHYLSERDEASRPIIVEFNPWWFKDHEDLAAQFLAQFRAKLIRETGSIRKVGDMLAHYSNAIGSAVVWSIPIPGLDKVVGFILRLFKREPKSVPQLKTQISRALEANEKRTVFLVDDIDRLTPNEIRELFKVIKALADFPNVTYLLAFDRMIVCDALHASLGVDGDAYIEKIVQVPFSLPAIDRIRLRKMLFDGLDQILTANPGISFDQRHWGNVYFSGLDHFIRHPRDVVRIISAISVTYPSLAGEVNPVDFIAIEILRLKSPEVYQVIRNGGEMFTKVISGGSDHDRKPAQQFHETWLMRVPEQLREKVKALVVELFPQLSRIVDDARFGGGYNDKWHAQRRICSKKVFDIYFQFGVPNDQLSRAELTQLINVCEISSKEGAALLMSAAAQKRIDGSSKARDVLDDLRDLREEVSEKAAVALISTLFDVGDDLLSKQDEEEGGMLSLPNRWRLTFTLNHLLERISETRWVTVLAHALADGKALGFAVYTVDTIDDHLEKPDQGRDTPLSKMQAGDAEGLRKTVLKRLSASSPEALLRIPDFSSVIHRWEKWSGVDNVRPVLQRLVNQTDFLPIVLERYMTTGRQWGDGDSVTTKTYELNPKSLAEIVNLADLEQKVLAIDGLSSLTENQIKAVEQFKLGVARYRTTADKSINADRRK